MARESPLIADGVSREESWHRDPHAPPAAAKLVAAAGG